MPPGWIARQEDVVATLERHESCSRNAARDQPALLEWDGGVIAAVQDERRCSDARQEVEDIEVSKRLQQPSGILGRGGKALELIEPIHLFERGIRQQ